MNKKLLIALSLVICLIVFVVFAWRFYDETFIHNFYETTDIADYGEYVGNFDNKTPSAFITTFFPEKIDESFKNVRYVYRARKGDSYAYEAYLEFTISDDTAFELYIQEHTNAKELQAFSYDDDIQQWIKSDIFDLSSTQEKEDVCGGYKGFCIGYAEIGKILINNKENKIIYIALGVNDGGIVTTGYLREYFQQFGIDPLEYAESRSLKTGKTGDGSLSC